VPYHVDSEPYHVDAEPYHVVAESYHVDADADAYSFKKLLYIFLLASNDHSLLLIHESTYSIFLCFCLQLIFLTFSNNFLIYFLYYLTHIIYFCSNCLSLLS
jgi:hypothetical protein